MLTPPSTDGYYSAGTSVQITALPAAGYDFNCCWLDSGIYTPPTIAMNAPDSVGLAFYCGYSLAFVPYFPSYLSSGSTSGFFRIQTGAGCPWTVFSGAAWFSVTSASSGTGPATVAYSASANSGGARSTTVNIASGYSETVTQYGATDARPTVLSMQPASGTGVTQTFTYQFFDPNGYGALGSEWINFEITPYAGPACDIESGPHCQDHFSAAISYGSAGLI